MLDTVSNADILLTTDNLLMYVWGNIRINDKILARLKLIPSNDGQRTFQGLKYFKIPLFPRSENITWMKKYCLDYVSYTKVFGRETGLLNKTKIKSIFSAASRLDNIDESRPINHLEVLALDFKNFLDGVSFQYNNIGITGSLLVNICNKASDIDLIIFCGPEQLKKNRLRLYGAIKENSGIISYNPRSSIVSEVSKRLSLDFRSTQKLLAKSGRFVDHVIYKNIKFDILFYDYNDNMLKFYDDDIVSNRNCILKGTIFDDECISMTPSTFKLKDDENQVYNVWSPSVFTVPLRKNDKVLIAGNLLTFNDGSKHFIQYFSEPIKYLNFMNMRVN